MHDDQHGTAIISGAGLLNALEIQGKKIEEAKLVVNGAGAAAISCTKLYMGLGTDAKTLSWSTAKVLSAPTVPTPAPLGNNSSLPTAPTSTRWKRPCGVPIFSWASRWPTYLPPEMVQSMNERPIVFALANPNPEIAYDKAMASRDDLIFATGRSDYPNQINNVLGFPYIFRGALDVRATTINEEMKRAATYAIAQLTKEPVPDVVNSAYGIKRLTFGPQYIIPKALDPRLLTAVARPWPGLPWSRAWPSTPLPTGMPTTTG